MKNKNQNKSIEDFEKENKFNNMTKEELIKEYKLKNSKGLKVT